MTCSTCGLSAATNEAKTCLWRQESDVHTCYIALSITEVMNDRGNYSTGSAVGRTTYDYSSNGHGPLSSIVLGGSKVTTDRIRLYIPGFNNKTKQ